MLLNYLLLEGVDKLFGVPGAAVMQILDQFDRTPYQGQIELIVCRHETGAAYLAHGYALVKNTIGVVLTTTGPGASNALTGASNAQSSGAGVLFVTGEVDQRFFGKGYLQEGSALRPDINQMFVNAVQYSAIVSSSENLAMLIEQALRVCVSLPHRAAHLSLPANIAAAPVGAARPTARIASRSGVSRATDIAAAVEVRQALLAASRPLIMLGNGCRAALRDPAEAARFEKFVTDFAVPVITTPNAKGVFPEDHECALRNYGMAACRWPMLYMDDPDSGHFDALLVLGSSLGELATTTETSDYYAHRLIPDGPFMQVDLDPGMIGRNYPATLGIVGEVGATIDAICAAAAPPPPGTPSRVAARRGLIGGIKRQDPFANSADRASEAAPTQPAAVMRIICDELESGHVFVDCGNCVGWALHNLVIRSGVEFHSALAMAPMGFAVGAVIGGKMADPAAPCVAITGDGAFLMHVGEIATAAVHRVGAVWVVLHDNDLHMVSEGMDAFMDRVTHRYPLGVPGPADLVKVAEGLGASAFAVALNQGASAFRDRFQLALRGAAGGQPQVVVVAIDPAPVPPFGWPTSPPWQHGPSWPQSIG